ncbi:remorin-like [Bidens hawaiensis]|uniref:remorin-like n=1 Tax=Bidens hawaiensis TaxID=980011 RepID=UPI00404B7EE4
MATAAEEETKKLEEVLEPEAPSDPPPPPAPEDKPIVPVVAEEPPADESKVLAVVEKPTEPCEEKKPEEKSQEGSVNRDAVLARVATEKKDALIKAWEESEKSKAENKAQQKLSSIGAWENSKKADLEAELKKIEEDLEKKKAKYIEKMKNKIALLHKTAEEKRAITEAKRGEEILKAEELSAKYRATGTTPKKGWFSS